MKKNFTIWLVKNETVFGGGEVHVLELAQGLTRRGYKVGVFSSVPELRDKCHHLGIETHRTFYPRFNYFAFSTPLRNLLVDLPLMVPAIFYNLAAYLWWSLWRRPEVIHLHSREEILLSGVLLPLLAKKVFWTDHGDLLTVYSWFEPFSLQKRLLNWVIRSKVNKVICVSKFLKISLAAVSGLPLSKFVTVYNGIESPARLKGARLASLARRNRLGFLGRLSEEKGVILLLETFKLLPDRYQLLIAGDGPQVSIVAQAAQLFPGRIKVLGFVENRDDFFNQIGIYVSTSSRESFGRSIAEAMVRGIPVVATSVGGVTEQIKDQVNGLLVANAKPEEIAKKIQLLQSEKLYNKLSGEAARSAERFSMSVFLDQTEEVYDS